MKGKLKIVYRVILIITLFLAIFILPRVAYDYSPAFFIITMVITFIRILLIFVFLIELTRFINDYVIKQDLPNWLKNITSLIYVLVALFMIFEGVFMFVPRSHHAGIPLCSKIWFFKYWKPINDYGFRDKGVKSDKTENVYVIGDSYAAGHGLKHIDSRFSNMLDTKLSSQNSDIQVINLGVNGADTKDEYNVIMQFMKDSGTKPEMLILQYFGNDIDKVARNNGLQFSGFEAYMDVPSSVKQVVQSSYFLNYMYWVLPHGDANSYIAFMQEAYNNEVVLAKHLDDLNLFINYARQDSIPLLVLVFPFMQDIPFSEELYINKITNYLDQQQVDYIDVSNLVLDLPVTDRVINNNDTHPSELVNQLVADEIEKYIRNKQIF